MDRQSDNAKNANQNPGGGRRRRRRRRKGGGDGRPPQQGAHSSGSTPRAQGGPPQQRRRSRPGGATQRRIDPFALFATYHLGLDENGGYRKVGIREIARRFGVQQHEIRDALTAYFMDKPALDRMRFDISLAELDVRVAPEGIDKGEIAKQLYAEFIEAGQKAGLFTDFPPHFDDDDDHGDDHGDDRGDDEGDDDEDDDEGDDEDDDDED